MPIALSRSDRRLIWTGAATLVLMVAAAGFLAGDPLSNAGDPSSRSNASGGTKALYLLLGDLGYRVSRWEQPPAELSDAAQTTLILAEPIEAQDADRDALLKFLDAGGRIIATGLSGGHCLGAAPLPDFLSSPGLGEAVSAAPSPMARVASSITIAPQGRWDGSAGAVELYRLKPTDAPVVVAFARGRGEALWWAAATPMTNLGLRQSNNLAFVLASIGARDGRRVLFDEYFHGARPTLGGQMWQSPVKWLLVQAGLFAVVLLLARARRSGPILEAAPESRLSPLEFVRTLGSLYRRAGATMIPLDAAVRRWRAGLARRLALPAGVPLDRLADAAERRWGADGARAVETLAACERAQQTGERLSESAALALVLDADRAMAKYVR